MSESTALIRTPDQRLRVFVSSTLQELLPERSAVKAAIASLQLSPVMFELGARPHPPRQLYRAYLEQSHIFVGIYWERYGWVAPGEAISGLEDEYQLCGPKPKLIYVKAPAPERDERLDRLLLEIQTDDMASYKPFSTPDELQELVADDLALLLTERFEATVAPPRTAGAPSTPGLVRPPLPRAPTRLIGRDDELATLTGLLGREDVQLITLLGPGGIGKSRLALALAEDAPVATFVDLSAVVDPTLVIPTIAETLAVSEGGSPLAALQRALSGRPELLVLDNFEQIIDAAGEVADLLEGCPTLTVVATSRTPLRVAAEHEFPVAPLAAPTAGASLADLQAATAVQLFVARAQAVRPSFALTADNGGAVAELTRRLDGLPLALELAAARTKLLSPAGLLRRLDRRFDLLEGGARDRPDRHQTLKATIDWSVNLLEPAERLALVELAVFAGGWSLDAAEAVCDPEGTTDFLDHLSGLVDDNLVVTYDSPQEGRFRLLESIRAYALGELEQTETADSVHARHADYFLRLAESARDQLSGVDQDLWLNRLETEHDNLRAALVWHRDHPADDGLARMTTALLNFWWIRGHFHEGRTWLATALDLVAADSPHRQRVVSGLGTLAWLQGDYPAAEAHYATAMELSKASGDRAQLASATGNLGIIALEQHDLVGAETLLTEALEISRGLADKAAVGPPLINLSLTLIRRGEHEAARRHLDEAAGIFRAAGDRWRLATALINLGDVGCLQHDFDTADRCFGESLRLAQELGDQESTAYALEGFASAAAGRGQADRAARLWGGAEALRTAIGNPRPPSSGASTYDDDVARMRDRLGADEFTRAWAAGRALPLATTVAAALDPA